MVISSGLVIFLVALTGNILGSCSSARAETSSALPSLVQEWETSVQGLQGSMTQLEALNSGLSDQNAGLKRSLDDLRSHVSALNEEIDVLSSRQRVIAERSQEKKDTVSSLQGRIDGLDRERRELEERIRALNVGITAKAKQYREIADSLAGLKRNVKGHRSETLDGSGNMSQGEFEGRKKDLLRQLSAGEEEGRALHGQKQDLEQKIAMASSGSDDTRKADLSQELVEANEELSVILTKTQALQKENAELAGKYREKDSQAAHDLRSLDEDKGLLAGQLNSWSQRSTPSPEVQGLRDRFDALREESLLLEQELSELQALSQRIAQEKARIQASLTDP